MVNTFYDEMRDIVRDVMPEFSQGFIEYVKIVPGNGTPDNPGPSQEVPFTLDATAQGVKFKYVDGTTIVQGDMQITMAVRDDVTPDMKGFVRIDTIRYKIKRVDPIPPAGQAVAYRIFFGK